MDEATAKTKWCPFVRCDGNNRHWCADHSAAPISRCVASACMAWHPDSPFFRATNALSGASFDIIDKTAVEAQNAAAPGTWEIESFPSPGGHCGLAGRPE